MWITDYHVTRFFIILGIGLQVICINSKEKEQSEFIPTHEWQIVHKGQKIPKGLHVRVNFETGITEAKLLDEKEKSNKNNALLEIPTDEETEKLLDTNVIKQALKQIKNDESVKSDENEKKKSFRSYEELKDDLTTLNLTAKVDAEILIELFEQYRREIEKHPVNEHAILRILEDFDFLAHQFDNGLEFVKQNGFNEIIYRNLNLTHRIKQATLKLFGALVQNNANVQIHALETGSIPIILRILNLESAEEVRSRAAFALSCLLRRFPLAQLRFVQNGGLFIITKLFVEENPIKIQMKLVTLMNDLLLENIHALQDSSNKNQNTLLDQYKLINLENLLLEQKWCEQLNKVLISILATDPDDHDSVEKCLISIHTIAKNCRSSSFNKEVLTSLRKKYAILAKEEEDKTEEESNSDFFLSIHKLCSDILNLTNVKTEL